MIAIGCHENLRLVPHPAKGDGMDDAVTIPLKSSARPACAAARFSILTSATGKRIRGPGTYHAKLVRLRLTSVSDRLALLLVTRPLGKGMAPGGAWVALMVLIASLPPFPAGNPS